MNWQKAHIFPTMTQQPTDLHDRVLFRRGVLLAAATLALSLGVAMVVVTSRPGSEEVSLSEKLQTVHGLQLLAEGHLFRSWSRGHYHHRNTQREREGRSSEEHATSEKHTIMKVSRLLRHCRKNMRFLPIHLSKGLQGELRVEGSSRCACGLCCKTAVGLVGRIGWVRVWRGWEIWISRWN